MRESDICSRGQVQHGGMRTARPAPVFPAIALPQATGLRLAQPPCAEITGAHGPGGSGVRRAQQAEGLSRALTLLGPAPPTYVQGTADPLVSLSAERWVGLSLQTRGWTWETPAGLKQRPGLKASSTPGAAEGSN